MELLRTATSGGNGPRMSPKPSGSPISASREPGLIPSLRTSGVPETFIEAFARALATSSSEPDSEDDEGGLPTPPLPAGGGR